MYLSLRVKILSVLFLVIAALGFVPPWLAALGMSTSSLIVVLNALRIGRGAERADLAPAMQAQAAT